MLLAVAGGCSDGGGGSPGGVSSDGGLGDAGGGACTTERRMPPDEGANHTTVCTPVSFGSKPPASGTHYPVWPVFRAYDQPVPWGFLVHALEHGAVVIAYNCPEGCAAELAAARQLIAETPPRPQCPRPPVILTPDPTLDVRFAAAAWGHVLRAACFDRQAFSAFIAERRDKGREFFPNDCGMVDLEAAGWCPG